MSSVFERLNKDKITQQPQQPNYDKMFEQFKKDPAGYLMKAQLKIPQTMNSPEQIVRHLAQTGQIPPQLRGMVNSMLGR
ncbi:MAG: hypothetical protein VZR95_10725 [Alphaproteobacteria bacterium]